MPSKDPQDQNLSTPLVGIRQLKIEDAATLAELVTRNRTNMREWDPARADSYYTEVGQRQRAELLLEGLAAGQGWPGVIVMDDRVVGQINLSAMVHFAFQKATLGYWVDEAFRGQGVATKAVALMVDHARFPLKLHRLVAHTQISNVPSHRVLEQNGFRHWGTASEHILVAGEWRDEMFWERIIS